MHQGQVADKRHASNGSGIRNEHSGPNMAVCNMHLTIPASLLAPGAGQTWTRLIPDAALIGFPTASARLRLAIDQYRRQALCWRQPSSFTVKLDTLVYAPKFLRKNCSSSTAIPITTIWKEPVVPLTRLLLGEGSAFGF